MCIIPAQIGISLLMREKNTKQIDGYIIWFVN